MFAPYILRINLLIMKTKLFLMLLLANCAFSQNDTIAIKSIGMNSEFTYKMLDQNRSQKHTKLGNFYHHKT